ncbi:MAG: aldo/keto reductase, partial [Alloscardovia omnicolens]|nr:aldo/keto reductase [Alloscardovia omnicolens]
STWDNSASERSMSDKVARSKYDASRAHDEQIIKRVHELSLRYGVSMAQISLAWLASQGVTAPIVGATSPRHFADAVRYGDVELTQTDVDYLSEPYVAHELVGLIEHK